MDMSDGGLPRGSQRGFTALETMIVTISVLVTTVAVFTLLTVTFRSTSSGEEALTGGLADAAGGLSFRGAFIATRGDVDVDGDDTINLAGSDLRAAVKVSFIVDNTGTENVNLTPPYTKDDTGTDPDASGLVSDTYMGFRNKDFAVTKAAWTVQFPGTDNGDLLLDP